MPPVHLHIPTTCPMCTPLFYPPVPRFPPVTCTLPPPRMPLPWLLGRFQRLSTGTKPLPLGFSNPRRTGGGPFSGSGSGGIRKGKYREGLIGEGPVSNSHELTSNREGFLFASRFRRRTVGSMGPFLKGEPWVRRRPGRVVFPGGPRPCPMVASLPP